LFLNLNVDFPDLLELLSYLSNRLEITHYLKNFCHLNPAVMVMITCLTWLNFSYFSDRRPQSAGAQTCERLTTRTCKAAYA